MKAILAYYTKYNIWANQKMADFFFDKNEELLSQFIENSFPSIRKTAMHIYSAEQGWLARLKNDTDNNRNLEDDFKTTNDVFDALVLGSKSFDNFVEKQLEDFFAQTICYHTWDGTPYEMQPSIMIHHCMNHSTYHRGQLITMARQLGMKSGLPSTDILYYARDQVI